MAPKKLTRCIRRASSEDSRKLSFERLEDRRMLASIAYATINTDLQSALNSAQNSVTTLLNTYQSGDNASIPFLGSSLGNAAQFAPQVTAALSALASTDPSTSVPDAFVHALGVLLVNDNDAQGMAADVHLPNAVAPDGSFQAYMRLHVPLNPVTTNFKTGLPALPLLLAGSALDFSVNSTVDFELSFNYSATVTGNVPHTTLTGGHPLIGGLPGSGHELVLVSNAQLPTSFSGTATLGFVQGTIGLASNQTSNVAVTATADRVESTPVRGPLVFNADAYLQLTGGISGVPAAQAFPTISTAIHLQWDNGQGGGPHVSFQGVTLNLGQFINNLLEPVLGTIQSVTGPIKPAIDVLNKSLPVLSDISNAIGGGDISLMSITSIAASYAGLGPLAGLFSNIATFISDFNAFDPSLGAINLGDFNLDGFNVQNSPTAGNPLDLANKYLTSFDTTNLPGNPNSYSSVVNALPVSDEVKASLQKLVSSLNGNPNSIDFEFPFLNSPGKAVFNMLMGRDSDLFTLKGNLAADAAESTGADLFGMGLSFNGAVHLAGQLTFAYDTYGLRELTRDATGSGSYNALDDLLDGFYLKTDSTLNFGGRIGISAGVSVGIAGASISGSVGTPDSHPISVSVDASKDTDHDSKLRFREFPSNPLDAFIVRGEIDAELTFEIQIGVKTPVGFLGYEKDFDIAHTVIFSFGESSPPPTVTLASPANGTGSPVDGSGVVQLYIGKEAIRRIGVDDHDGGPDGKGESYVIKHIGDDSTGETIEIDAFGKSQTITGVKTIWANGDIGDLTVTIMAGVEADVVINNAPDPLDSTYTGLYTNRGHALLTYLGSGTARLTAGQLDSTLSGGFGSTFLYGGAGNDTFATGAGDNFINDEEGENLIIDSATTGYVTLNSSSNAYNTLKVIAGKNTTSISEMPDGNYLRSQIQDSSGHTTFDELPYISQLMIDAQSSSVAIDIGALNMHQVTVNGTTGASGGRSFTLDGPAPVMGNPNVLTVGGTIDSNVRGVSLAEDNIGATNIDVFGLSGTDTLTIKLHGGITNITDLSGVAGTLFLDASAKQSGYNEGITLTTPVRALGSTITANGYGPFGSGGFRIQAAGDPDIVFQGMTSADSINLNASAAPFGAPNQVSIDAFSLNTALHVKALGSIATNNILLSALSEHGTVTIDGGNTSTTATIGTSSLAPIYGSVSVANAILTVDNSGNTNASDFTLTDSSLAGWDTGLFITPPRLSFSGIFYITTIKLAAGDQLDIESTPLGVSEVDVKNLSATRDLVGVAGTTSGTPSFLAFDGDFKLYLGAQLSAGGTVSPSISQLANARITFNFTSTHYAQYNPTLVQFFSFANHSYTLGGDANLAIVDQTIGLNVTITDYRAQDGVLINLPGGSVNADLTRTSAGTLTLDGMSRLLLANPSAQNNVTVHARAGAVYLQPSGDHNSVLPMFNTLYLLGEMPQDSLHVYDSTNNIAVANDPIPADYARFVASAGDPNTVQAGQPFDFTVAAQDAVGMRLTNYAGQVQWYAYNRTTGHYFSSNYEPFAPADQGQHAFHGIVLSELGVYSLGFDDGWNASSITFTVNTSGQGSLNPDAPRKIRPAEWGPVARQSFGEGLDSAPGTLASPATIDTILGEQNGTVPLSTVAVASVSTVTPDAVAPVSALPLGQGPSAASSLDAGKRKLPLPIAAAPYALSWSEGLAMRSAERPSARLAPAKLIDQIASGNERLRWLNDIANGLAVSRARVKTPRDEALSSARRKAFEQLALDDEAASAPFANAAGGSVSNGLISRTPRNTNRRD